MPRNAPRLKMESIRRSRGGDRQTAGPASAERMQKAEELAREHGHRDRAFLQRRADHRLAQCTIGLEFWSDRPEVYLALVPTEAWD